MTKVVRALRAMDSGFRSIQFDPTHDMTKLRNEIAHRNVVAEAWIQTADALRASMGRAN